MPSFGNRIALLIAIDDYPKLGSLNTPFQDAKLMLRTLQRCGFARENIVTLTNGNGKGVSAAEIRRALVRFGEMFKAFSAPQEDEQSCAVIYFAGHGVTHRGESYLLSDHASLDAAGIAAEGVPLAEVIRRCAVRLGFPLLLLIDACQSFSKAQGLQLEPVRLPELLIGDMIVDLATAPGEVAYDGAFHSPYAAALSDLMPTIDYSIGDVLAAVRGRVRSSTGARQNSQSISTLSSRLMLMPSTPTRSKDAETPDTFKNMALAHSDGELGPRRSYTDDEVRTMGHLIHKLKAKDTSGGWAYYFVLVEPHFESEFLAAIHSDIVTIDIENYGTIIASCYGEGPTPDLRNYLFDRYGFEVDDPRSRTVPKAPPSIIPISPGAPATAPSMLVALRQQLGLGRWHWLVMLVGPKNRMPFAEAADRFAALDRQGLLGGLRRVVGAVAASHFEIEKLATFGTVLYRGLGENIPANVSADIRQRYGVTFDWKDWANRNGVTADCP